MKRFVTWCLIFALLSALVVLPVSAGEEVCSPRLPAREPSFFHRAGGGSAGGGSGGGGGSSSSHRPHGGSGQESDPLHTLLSFCLFLLLASSATIVFRLKLSAKARNAKKLMRLSTQKDSMWKYRSILTRVRKTYFAVQSAWTNSDMTPARAYMSAELFQSFQSKLAWMKYQNNVNVLKRIRLRAALPIAMQDAADDASDYIWFYIKGNMIDYTQNTETGEITDGSRLPASFCEYWQFVRNASGEWVLHAILQEDEGEALLSDKSSQ